MATIDKRSQADGTIKYRVKIRKKNADISQTFSSEEDAKLYVFYKERLIDSMEIFDVPLRERITIEQLFELKIKEFEKEGDKRSCNDYSHCMRTFIDIFGSSKFIIQISYEDWLSAAKKIYLLPVYRGTKNENNKREMSPNTLKRIFANASACISYYLSKGIDLQNHPLQVIRTFILPIIKKKNDTED